MEILCSFICIFRSSKTMVENVKINCERCENIDRITRCKIRLVSRLHTDMRYAMTVKVKKSL